MNKRQKDKWRCFWIFDRTEECCSDGMVLFLTFALDRRTLHSPIDFWYFHLESAWTHGVHLESMWNFFGREPSQIFVYFHLDSTWIPDGLHGLHMEYVESTPFHITLHSNFHLSVDSTWTPAVLIIYSVGIGLLIKTKSHDGPKNK